MDREDLVLEIIYAAQSLKGVRENNQDNYFVNGYIRKLDEPSTFLYGTSHRNTQLFAVCDGMGGESKGNEASFMAVHYLQSEPISCLESQFEKEILILNDIIWKYAKSRKLHMGTTFAGVLFHKGCLQLINLGDSRVYQIRNHAVTQISHDHTEIQALIEAGVLKKDDYVYKKAGNRITQYLGAPSHELALNPYVLEIVPKDGDRYLLCSDGLSSFIANSDIAEICLKNNVKIACQQMIKRALEQGSTDNITAVLIEIHLS